MIHDKLKRSHRHILLTGRKEKKVAWLSEVHRSFSRTRELAKPHIRNIQTEYSGRATRFFFLGFLFSSCEHTDAVSCLIANAPGGLWDARNDEAAVLQIFFSPSSLQVRSSVGYADIVSSKGLSLAHLEATRVATNASRIVRDFIRNYNNVRSLFYRELKKMKKIY